VRHTAEPAKGHDVHDEGDNEEQWLARNEQKDSHAENCGYEQIDQNCQSKLHDASLTGPVTNAKAEKFVSLANSPWTA